MTDQKDIFFLTEEQIDILLFQTPRQVTSARTSKLPSSPTKRQGKLYKRAINREEPAPIDVYVGERIRRARFHGNQHIKMAFLEGNSRGISGSRASDF